MKTSNLLLVFEDDEVCGVHPSSLEGRAAGGDRGERTAGWGSVPADLAS